jgi:hypothetical protein
VSRASTAATTGVLLVLLVQLAVTALVVHPIVCIPQLRVLQGPMQVERQHVNHVVPVNIQQPPEELIAIFAVRANILQTPEKQPIVIKIALPASTKLRYNWSVLRVQVAVTALVVHPVVCIPQLRVLQGPMQVERHVNHVVPVNIQQPPEEQPIVIFALLARTSVIPLPQPNTIKQTIVPFAVRVNIRQTPEEQPIVIFALLARTSVIPPPQPNTIKQTIVPFVGPASTTTKLLNLRKHLACHAHLADSLQTMVTMSIFMIMLTIV